MILFYEPETEYLRRTCSSRETFTSVDWNSKVFFVPLLCRLQCLPPSFVPDFLLNGIMLPYLELIKLILMILIFTCPLMSGVLFDVEAKFKFLTDCQWYDVTLLITIS